MAGGKVGQGREPNVGMLTGMGTWPWWGMYAGPGGVK